MSWSPAGASIVFLLVVAMPAHAQQRDTLRTDTMVFRIGEIRVQARRPVTTVGGASGIEVTVDSLGLPPAPTVAEVLREIPAVHVRTNSRGESEISVRGSESRQVALLMDGVPLTLGWDGRTDVSVIPATAPHEVTLVRGLSSILHGPNVLGGVVEMSVARGTGFPVQSAMQLAGGFDGVGGYAGSASGSVPMESSGGRWLVRAGVGFRDSPGMPLASGVVEPVPTEDDLRLNTDAKSRDGFLAVRYARDGGSWFTVATTTSRVERGIAAELGVEEPRLWRYPEVSRTIVATSAGTGDRTTPLGRGDMEISVGFDVGHSEIVSYEDRSYTAVNGSELGDDKTTTLRVLGDHTLGSSGDLHTAITFADIKHDAKVDGTLSQYEQKLLSLGGESVWRLLERPTGTLQALRLSFGGVYDQGRTPLTGGLPGLGTLSDWGARVGLTALVNGGKTLFHAGMSRRGRFPALREAYSESLTRFEPNPELAPEHLVAVEGGVTNKLGRGEIQFVAFNHNLTDAIRRITLPNGKRQRVNSDQLKSRGIEVLLAQNIGGVSLGGDLTLQAVDLIDPTTSLSTEPENVPEWSGTAFVRLPLGSGFTAGAEAEFTGPQFCQHPDSGADVRLDGGSWLNGHLARVWNLATGGYLSRMETRMSMTNASSTALYDQCGLPRSGRLFSLQVRLF